MFDVLRIDSFLDDASLQRVMHALREAEGAPAPVYGRGAAAGVEPRTRRATIVAPAGDVVANLDVRLRDIMPVLGSHFGVTLTHHEPVQFLRYREGDFFVAHQDGNTPVVHDDTRFRRVSVIVFLNDQSETPREGAYGGGSLVLHGSYPRFDEREHVLPAAGTLVAFRSETTHEVVPVTHGERFTIVSWYR